MMIYLCNGLSESMKRDPNMKQIPFPLSKNEFRELVNDIEFESVIGHSELADYLTDITDKKITFNRRGILVNYDDYILLVSMNGRLPENPTKVDYDGRLNFSFVRFEKQNHNDFANTLNIIHKIKEAV